jgi:DNA-binding beta-propeller fold protein YncE
LTRAAVLQVVLGALFTLAPEAYTYGQTVATIHVEPGAAPLLPYRYVRDFLAVPPDANFGEVAGVALDGRGHVYVFNRGPRPLMEFDVRGRYVRELAQGTVQRAHSVRVDHEGNLWLVDDLDHHIIKLDSRGRVRLVLGRRGHAGDSSLFNRPTDVAVNSRGEIYVSDGYINSRIAKFSPTGAFLRSWGSKGTAPGQFDIPHALVIDSRDRVYVADRENRRIQVFDADGKLLAVWTGLAYPQGLFLTPGDTLYVGDTRQIVKLDASGRLLGVFAAFGRGPGELSGVHGLAVGPKGELFTAELLGWRAQKFELNSPPVRSPR